MIMMCNPLPLFIKMIKYVHMLKHFRLLSASIYTLEEIFYQRFPAYTIYNQIHGQKYTILLWFINFLDV